MLYIKFNIQDEQQFKDFQQVYEHMVRTRQPNFEFEETEEYEIDWENMSQKVIEELLAKQNNEPEPEVKRYNNLFPKYADAFLKKYIKTDKEIAGAYGFDIKGIFNYLEYSFEVDFDSLERINNSIGVLEFSTGNYPFGGLERMIMTLKSFGLFSSECFDGFNVVNFEWSSEFNYTAIINDEKTKLYKQNKS